MFILLLLILYSLIHIALTYTVHCNTLNDSISVECTITCGRQESCDNLNIVDTDFLEINSNITYIEYISSLSILCNKPHSCNNVTVDCDSLYTTNCSVGCLNDNSCINITLLCGDDEILYNDNVTSNLEECFIYTISSNSAIDHSIVDCKYHNSDTNNTKFCGYKCGNHTDGCSDETNVCIDDGINSECGCIGKSQACDEIYYFHIYPFDSTFIPFITTNSNNNSNGKSFIDYIKDNLLYICISCGAIIIILIFICFYIKCHKNDNNKLTKNVSRSYSINSGNLNDKLLANYTSNTLNKNKQNNDKKKKKDQTKLSYDDTDDIGSFKMIPDSDLGDNLLDDNVILDEENDDLL